METAAEIVAQYTPRDMIDAMVQEVRPSTFLLDMFVGGNIETHDTDVIEIDIVKGGQTKAAYVSRASDPTVVGKKGFDTLIHAVPYVYEEITFTSKDVKTRLPGNSVYTQGAKARMDAKVGKWLATLEDRLTVLKECQVAEAMQTGKLTVVGDGVSYIVDFQMDADHLIQNTGTANWGSGTEKKVDQLENMAQLIRKKGAPSPTMLLMDVNAAREFLADEDIRADLQNRRIENGTINPVQLSGQKATWLGRYSRVGLEVEVYSYHATYDNAGVDTPYLAENTCIMTSTSADWRMHYGMIENMLEGDYEGESFPLIGMDNKGKNGWVSLESAPMFGLHQPDAVVCLTTTDA